MRAQFSSGLRPVALCPRRLTELSFERGASAVKGPTKPPRAAGTNDGSNTLSSSADRPRPPLSALFSSLSFGSAVNWGRERSLTRRNPPAL
ncbi:hypothetical protein PC115_g20573 [Phytophthora cactorum]|uniref:Uncharacterized protein n=1 Tax=Phytophthora cactorum TaxID=29920 RepID=A0A8T1ANY5_9STRA|nr:hypothetical protein PC115_g20573 [Phytophthora cactorum]